MDVRKLLGALAVTVGLCSPALAGNPFSLASLKAWTGHVTGTSCDAGCGPCASAHVCCREDACKVAELICQLQTACKPRHRERAAAKLDHYDCCCYPEIVPALIGALKDCDDDVREEAAESLGELKCCTPEVIAALEALLGDPDRGVRSEARESLERCGVCVVEVKPCRCCGGCSGCGTCGCGGASEAMPDYAPAPMPPTQGDPQARVILPYHSHDRAVTPTSLEPRTGLRRLFSFGRR